MKTFQHSLTRRERQIMDVLFKQGRASVAQVLEGLPEPPGYSAVRAHLRILEDKGFVSHEQDGPRYLYSPTMTKDSATRSALAHLLDTFFNGSTERAMAALLDERDLSTEQLDRLSGLIDRARKQELA